MQGSLIAGGVLTVSIAVAWLACSTTPPITVVNLANGDKAEEVRGDAVKMKRSPQETLVGIKPGYFVVRNVDDWKAAWPSNAEIPQPPASLDAQTQMLLLTAPEAKGIVRTQILKAVETAELYYVYVKETKAGEACPVKTHDRPAVDGVVVARADKPVRFIVDRDRAEGCGEAPTASIQCRLTTQNTWTTGKVSAQPGDTVECEMNAEARGKFEVVDRVLSFADMPPGSSAKLAFAKGPTRGSFNVDVYGTFTVRAEAADEQGRRGTTTTTIEVAPTKSRDVLAQVVWTNFDRSDDPSTFPRVVLRVAEPGPKGQRCTPEVPVPGLCEGKQQGAYTYVKVPASDRKLHLTALYLDERAEKGPSACLHVWFEGQRTVEVCDRAARSADDVWDIGVIDTTSGKLLEAAAAKELLDAAADAGAPPPPAKKPAAKPAPKK